MDNVAFIFLPLIGLSYRLRSVLPLLEHIYDCNWIRHDLARRMMAEFL